MSALYVDARGAPVRLLRDGPAIELRRPWGTQGRVPIRCLSRLVLQGPAEIDGALLEALLEAGIPISFLRRDGTLLGGCLPVRSRRTDTRALLEQAAAAGRLGEVRENWCAAEERRLVLDLRTTLGLVMQDLRRRSVNLRIHAALDARGAPLPAEEMLARMRGLLEAHLAQLLLAEGLGFRFQGGDPECWNLRADCAHILILALVPSLFELADYMAAHPERHRREKDIHRRFARRYEREAPRIARLLELMLARLRRCLREVLS